MRWRFRRLPRLRLLKYAGITLVSMAAVLSLMWYALTDEIAFNRQQIIEPRGHRLCVVIPYRNRWPELQELAPHLHQFLEEQHVEHRFVVMNQTDAYRFNRASLVNVGWYEADRLGCDFMAMHDVDLIPLNKKISYRWPGEGNVRHISAGKYHPIKRYDYPKFIGGILMLTMADFKRVNGMSNKYWGWGMEDDEFYLRLKEAGLAEKILRPTNLETDRTNTFRHVHSKERKRDYAVVGNQKAMARRRDRVSGLNTLKYSIASRRILKIDSATLSVVNVKLECDRKWTSYCSL
ncbi:hypothetical protein QR680_019090 [Steinernema hermaphroditum]|uniref:Galactosyltransferase C-terminal domain-containing protein n=1 Tax=Steinernema hermaphroditum TaxID=289476 RepID=A0AA39HJW2_9BILA|nr:hypothetical protein QR680_019090 [Steinernema hermaphroditum]